MTNPLCDPYLVLTKVYSGGKYLKQAISETPIEPSNKAATVKICYGVLEKDIYLSHIISGNAARPPKSAIRLILKIALYMLEFMDKNDYMTVDCAVELAKKLGKSGAAGFVNAFLRSYKIPALPERVDEAMSVRCSAPLWLVKALRRSYKGQAEEILSAPSHGVCVRFERGEENYLSKPHEDTPFKGVYIFRNFVRDDGFLNGDYTFQSVGSVAICDAVEGGENLLDVCAAPGGKSVLLSKKFASVTACELHSHRVELIKSYASRMGAENVEVRQADSTRFLPEWEGAFDGVLCDVPCTGLGTAAENPDLPLRKKEEDLEELKRTQRAILENCSRYVKKGGYLIYSTCSLLQEENDGQVGAFLSAHPEFALAAADSPLPHEKKRYGLQFLPDTAFGAGFYVSRLRRI